ncbi:hypothetical protein HK414_23730 [Ramlibacter terrae]|uniref:Twin-arginine translocation signal domain-containing protein n=1 Tax=Ramlibacter terrae TaxID=2732511 RepID=A0ABX6P749_9BURK|nr:hypothetical protein HK414_23730 [Ramlibacter terrae]
MQRKTFHRFLLAAAAAATLGWGSARRRSPRFRSSTRWPSAARSRRPSTAMPPTS